MNNPKTCPHCGCELRAERYERHLARQHSPEAEEKKASLRAKHQEEQERMRIEGNQFVTCSICFVSLKQRNLGRHKSRSHQVTVPSQQRNPQKNVITHVSLIETPCTCGGNNENCFKCFGTGIYEKEVIDDPPSSPALPSKKGYSSRSVRPLGGFASDFRGNDYSIREGGRFSSSPLHDDFGDESSS